MRHGVKRLRRSRFWRRRRFVVNRPLQSSLVLSSFLYALVIVLVVALSLFVPLLADLRSADSASIHAWEAATNVLYLHERLWVPVLFTLAAVCLHALLVSHRIAGPLYRFSSLFRSIAAGTIPGPAKLRRGDLLHPEMEQINEMLTSIRDRVGRIETCCKELPGSAAAVREAAAGCSPAVAEKLDDLESKLRCLEAETGRFKLL